MYACVNKVVWLIHKPGSRHCHLAMIRHCTIRHPQAWKQTLPPSDDQTLPPSDDQTLPPSDDQTLPPSDDQTLYYTSASVWLWMFELTISFDVLNYAFIFNLYCLVNIQQPCHNSRPWNIVGFKIELVISRKRHKIVPELPWNANRNSCTIYRMVPFPMTLSDP